MTLKTKTTLLTLFLSGAMIILLLTVSLLAFRLFSLSTAQEHVRTTAEIVRVSLTEAMINGVIDRRESFLRRLAEVEGMQNARVIRGPEVIRQFGKGFENEHMIDAVEQAVIASGVAYFGMIAEGTVPVFRGTIPFVATSSGKPNCLECHHVNNGTVLGAITIHLSMANLKRTALYTIGLMLVIVVVFSGVITFFFRLQMTPVVTTAQGMQKIVARAKDGDFNGQLDCRGSDEMGMISRDLNQLMNYLQNNLSEISHDVSKLMRCELKPSHNLITTTSEIVEVLLDVSHFKQSVEEDQTTQEVYFRISKILYDKFSVVMFSIYEVTSSQNYMKSVVVDGDFNAPCKWCDPNVLLQADACRAQRTGRVVDSFDNQFICRQFKHDHHTATMGHLCLPVLHSGHVGNILQIVSSRHQGVIFQYMRPFIEAYLRESAPTLEAKRLLETLRESALRDPLTGLHNRRFLEEYVDTLIATTKRKNNQLSVLMMDLDHFKDVNDTYGHDAGDTVLKSLAKVLSAQVRTSDLVIRFGGEEFLVILQESEGYTGLHLAEKIRDAVENLKVNVAGDVIQKTISIGVAGFPSDSDDVWEVLKSADVALYHAKDSGRNLVVKYTAQLREKMVSVG